MRKEEQKLDYKLLLQVRDLGLTPESVDRVIAKLQEQFDGLTQEINELDEQLDQLESDVEASEIRRRLHQQRSGCYAQKAEILWRVAYLTIPQRPKYLEKVKEIYESYYPVVPGIRWFNDRYMTFRDLAIMR